MTDEEFMSDDQNDTEPVSDRASDPLSGLLRSALAEAPVPERSLLPGIQQRIRVRTKGRYFRDRWSTARDPVSYLLMAALLILILAAALFLVMQPLMEAPTKTQLPTPATDPLATDAP